MRIGHGRVGEGGSADTRRLSFPVASDRDRPDTLWFEVPTGHADLLSTRGDAALVALLVAAMHDGEDVHLDAEVTDALAGAASDELQSLLRLVTPDLKRIRVDVARAEPAADPAPGRALAFSGGVDSFATLDRQLLNAACASDRVTHLVFTNVGSHDPVGRPLFHDRLRRLASIGPRLGVPLVPVDSNLSDFYWPASWRGTHVTRNVAAGLALQGGVRRLFHASTSHWAELVLGESSYQSAVEPALVPMLGTDAFEIVTTMSNLDRLGRTRIVAEVPVAWDFLDVCTAEVGGTNCGACHKCQVTMIHLEIIGAQERFAHVFDLDQFRRGRNDFLTHVFTTDDDYYVDLVAHLRAAGIAPRAARRLAWLRGG